MHAVFEGIHSPVSIHLIISLLSVEKVAIMRNVETKGKRGGEMGTWGAGGERGERGERGAGGKRGTRGERGERGVGEIEN